MLCYTGNTIFNLTPAETFYMNIHDETNHQETDTALDETNNNGQLEEQLKACNEQRDEWKERCLRISADFENYKKRTEKEKSLWMQTAQSSVLSDLLTTLDNFDRAFEVIHQQETSPEFLKSIAGFELIYKNLQKMLEKYNVLEIKDIKTFDPHKHEALMHIESPEHTAGDIVKVLQKGYMFKDQILRPAKVSVAK